MNKPPKRIESLFPPGPITWAVAQSSDQCPYCGENRVTDQLHGFTTYLCGASGHGKVEITICEGDRFLPFLELEDKEEWWG